MSQSKQFIVTIENEAGIWDELEAADIKDDISQPPGRKPDPSIVTVEEISARGKPKRINSHLTMLTYVTEDAI